jgi:chemotaxis response regulator CheB
VTDRFYGPIDTQQVHSTLRPGAIGFASSTGGLGVLRRILAIFPGGFPCPILIVQHLAPGFAPSVVEWLAERCRLEVMLARHGEPLRPGLVVLAPEDRHMEVGRDRRVHLLCSWEAGGPRPAADRLFASLARVYRERACGVILSGMGTDGARGLKLIQELGGLALAQDPRTCVAPGMPAAALRAQAAVEIHGPEELARRLCCFTDASGEMSAVKKAGSPGALPDRHGSLKVMDSTRIQASGGRLPTQETPVNAHDPHCRR